MNHRRFAKPAFLSAGILLVWAAAWSCGTGPAVPSPEAGPEPVQAERAQKPSAPERQPVPLSEQSLAEGLHTRSIILTYHDMRPTRDKDTLWFDCTPDELVQQLDWLEDQGAAFVSLRELVNGLAGGTQVPENAVAITFADNYKGFLLHAWPILEERKIPVTLFVHTGHVGSQKGRPKMTWAELKGLKASGLVDVQSQTVSHPADISKLPESEMERELQDSWRAIAKNLPGAAADMIAYPNGKHSRETAEAAARAGYRAGFTESQIPAEESPSMLLISRYVHTKYREAWREARASERSARQKG